MTVHMIALLLGFMFDLCLGDPLGWPHIIRGMGWLINRIEGCYRRCFKKTPTGERWAGAFLVLSVIILCTGIAWCVLFLSYQISPIFGLIIESLICYQMLAVKSLRKESMKVAFALEKEGLKKARTVVSMIVGRDTDSLSEEGIVKATVETVAENTSDGVIAPLLFMALFGGIGGIFYKAVNTMDSMIGYKNDAYFYFGFIAAKLDDICNFIPARLAAYLMIASAGILKLDVRGAKRIYKRDRFCHKSPNSAHTEAVCAGALGIQLAGDAYYFGELHKKPFIGDATRPICMNDIKRVNELLYMTSYMMIGMIGIFYMIIGMVA